MSALRYLYSLSVSGVVWLIAGLYLGNYLTDTITFQEMTPEDFSSIFKIVMVACSSLGFVLTSIWFIYGSTESVTLKMGKAKNVWVINFIISLIASIVAVVIMGVICKAESLESLNYVIISLCSFLTLCFNYWICTFFWSPPNVKYIPLFK
jgi:hypothetical protein